MFSLFTCCVITSKADLALTAQAVRDVRSQLMIEDYAPSLCMPFYPSILTVVHLFGLSSHSVEKLAVAFSVIIHRFIHPLEPLSPDEKLIYL